MPRSINYTIAYERQGTIVDLCKVMFGGDGSYYVTAPYHPHNKAIAAKITINYAHGEAVVSFSDALELAVLDDDQQRLKISHHPDGFLQFSGHGVRSGRDENGIPRGIGVKSWSLARPTLGPSFGLAFADPLLCGRRNSRPGSQVIFSEEEIGHMRAPEVKGLAIEGYYFPLRWREFVYRTSDGNYWLNLLHPRAQATKRLRIILASKESGFPGVIGLEARPHSLEVSDEAGFALTTSTGNLRRNREGDLIGDQLLCSYPATDPHTVNLPTLNYSLNDPPYQAPPGTARP